MIAGLLYLIGLIAVLISVVIIGYGAPMMFQTFSAAMDAGDNVFATIANLAGSLNWALLPIIGGLALMGFGRIIMLLGSINRSLRGQA
jgi:Flp pilus assembly pilin Flp